MKIAVIIPAYNEEETIAKIVHQIWQVLTKLMKKHLVLDYQILVVDDGSKDQTAEFAKKAGAIVLEQERNKGKGAAKRTGWLYALQHGFDWILNLDADGQHSPEDMPKFIQAAIKTNADIILPRRKFSLQMMGLARFQANLWQSLAVSVRTGKRVHDSQCDFRMCHRKVLEKVKTKSSRFEQETEFLILALRHGFSFAEVPVETIYFKGRKSRIRHLPDIVRYLYLLIKSLTWG